MTVFGSNLLVIAKELNIPIVSIETFKFNDSTSVALYDTKSVGVLLNLPLNVYSNYNAWFQLPGEWDRTFDSTRTMVFNKVSIEFPVTPMAFAAKVAWPDIFTFMNKVYCKNVAGACAMRLFDLIYTTARLNKRSMEALLKQTAIIW